MDRSNRGHCCLVLSSSTDQTEYGDGRDTAVLNAISDFAHGTEELNRDPELVRIWFEGVNADNWVRFIDLLTADAIRVDTATVTRKEPGRVNVRVTVDR